MAAAAARLSSAAAAVAAAAAAASSRTSARARPPGWTAEAAQRPSSAAHVDVHAACGGDGSAANVLPNDGRPALRLAPARTRRAVMAALAGIGLLTAAEERALSVALANPADISAATAGKLPFDHSTFLERHTFLNSHTQRLQTDGGLIFGGDEGSGAPNVLKNVIITGGTSGIGKATATELARRGMSVLLESVIKEDSLWSLVEIRADILCSCGICDLSSLRSVRAFAASVVAGGQPLHVLINNAGIMACPQTYTEDGFELQFEVNHLGHFLLTSLLLNTLALSASPGSRSRVVNVTSAAEQIGHLDFDDLNFKYSRKYDAWGSYAQSKLANCLFTRELAKRCLINELPITSNCVHPGIVDTQLIRWVLPQFVLERRAATPDISARFAKFIGLKTPEEGAEGVVYLASASEVEGKTGRYYNSCTEAAPSQLAQDPALATRLWEVSMELTGAVDVPAILPSEKARPVAPAVVV
eukprot:SM000044S16032  [mRNA]  locus=s44:642619:645734:+ [translate_table: standard]